MIPVPHTHMTHLMVFVPCSCPPPPPRLYPPMPTSTFVWSCLTSEISAAGYGEGYVGCHRPFPRLREQLLGRRNSALPNPTDTAEPRHICGNTINRSHCARVGIPGNTTKQGDYSRNARSLGYMHRNSYEGVGVNLKAFFIVPVSVKHIRTNTVSVWRGGQ